MFPACLPLALAVALPGAALASGPYDGAVGADGTPLLTDAAPFVSRRIRPAAPATMAPQIGGEWGPVMDWPLVAIHAALLPTGNVLAWDATPDDADDDPHTTDNYTTRVTLWDPIADTHVATNNDTDTDLFCAGSAHLWDGRILFAGGDGARAGANGPLANSNLYDPDTNTWRRTENMNAPRWYSSVAALPNGEMLTFGGNYSPDPIAEVFDHDREWRALPLDTGGRDWLDDYQWIQATPEGSVLAFGPQNLLAEIDTDGAGRFTESGPRDDVDYRSYGSYAMYDIGKILVAGGGDSTDTAVIIDTASRQATDAGRMNTGRRQHNLTVLADGSVLITGGNDDGTKNISTTGGVFTPELWNPATGAFTELNPMNADRQYHSIALLLADGRVLSAGGGICGDCYAVGYEERNGAVFSPPYLFGADGALADRARLSGLPAAADYGARLSARSAGGADIVRAHLIKLGSATHSENQDQRLVPLELEVAGDSLGIRLPSSRDVAPPGHYSLFAVDAAGVPSTGDIIRVGQPLLTGGDAVTSTLEPGAWDSYVVPTVGALEITLTASAPVELYIARDEATGPGRLERASCRAAAVGMTTQRCRVDGDAAGERWYVTVHGGGRADYRLVTRGQPASGMDDPTPVDDMTERPTGGAPDAAQDTAQGTSSGTASGERPASGSGAPTAEAPRSDVASAGSVVTGGGAVGGALTWLAVLSLVWRRERRFSARSSRSAR